MTWGYTITSALLGVAAANGAPVIQLCLPTLMKFIFHLMLFFSLVGEVYPNPFTRSHCCKALYMNVRGLKDNLQDVAVASSKFGIILLFRYFCFELPLGSTNYSAFLSIFRSHFQFKTSQYYEK